MLIYTFDVYAHMSACIHTYSILCKCTYRVYLILGMHVCMYAYMCILMYTVCIFHTYVYIYRDTYIWHDAPWKCS